MPTVTIHISPEVLSRLTAADAGPVEIVVTLATETANDIKEVPVVPSGPLAGLLTSGLLKPGTPLRLVQTRANRSANATVLGNGSITDGRTLADLRDELEDGDQ
ncbi:hypothetical protein ACOZ38_06655 [Sphaerisporangium viridialbum]|uniref:hypothetical protein n=1 Tax=Sphaerisporangium viridialbum TaxID=46189 RepID=UPI003C73DE2B